SAESVSSHCRTSPLAHFAHQLPALSRKVTPQRIALGSGWLTSPVGKRRPTAPGCRAERLVVEPPVTDDALPHKERADVVDECLAVIPTDHIEDGPGVHVV